MSHAKFAQERSRPNSRDKILAAADALVREAGAGKFSLDAVAERAGISKGGLLYNFPTKSSLLMALVGEYVAALEAESAAAAERMPGGRNRIARGYVSAARDGEVCGDEAPCGMLAVLAENPELLEPMKDHHQRLCQGLRQADDPGKAMVAFLAIEGMRALDLFGIDPLDDADRSTVFDELETLLAG